MPSVINSDNGVISGTSGLKTSGSNDGLLDFQSNGTRIAGITTSAFQVGTDNISAVNSMGFRNRIINGDMRIDQRNAGASVTVNNGNQNFCVDRWWGQGTASAGVFTLQRSTIAPTGFVNSLLATVTTVDSSLASTDLYDISQNIEGFNVADLGWGTANAATVTLSFWVRSSVTGTFGGAFVNSAANRSYPFTYTISATNTWEQKSITVSGDTSGTWLTNNGIGIRVYFGLGLGSTYSGTAGAWSGSFFISATGATNLMATNGATFYITGVQLEAGSVATPFERRDYGRELMMCQRYYQKSYEIGTVPGTSVTGTYLGLVAGSANTSAASNGYTPTFYNYKVEMRAAPTITIYDAAGNSNRVSTLSFGGLVRTDNENIIQTTYASSSSVHINTNTPASTYPMAAFVMSIEL